MMSLLQDLDRCLEELLDYKKVTTSDTVIPLYLKIQVTKAPSPLMSTTTTFHP